MPSKHALALVIGLSLAATANAEEYRQHEAHVHGQVEFNIAQDGKDLLVEITAPGADVVGFEHAPENTKQEQALKQALTTLRNTEQLFAITPRAKCVIEDIYVTHTLKQEDHEEHNHETHDKHAHNDHHADHEHEKHDHKAHHNQHKHDDHAGHEHDKHNHDAHHDKHENGGHGEFTAQYRFHCDAVSALNRIDTAWFKHFPATEFVSVNLFTDTTQSSTKLNKDNAKISIQ